MAVSGHGSRPLTSDITTTSHGDGVKPQRHYYNNLCRIFRLNNVDGVYVIGLRFTSCLPGASHVTSTPAEKFNRNSLTVTFLVGPLAITTNTSKNMESIDISHHRHNSIVDEPKPRARVSYGTLHTPPATFHVPLIIIIIITNRV